MWRDRFVVAVWVGFLTNSWVGSLLTGRSSVLLPAWFDEIVHEGHSGLSFSFSVLGQTVYAYDEEAGRMHCVDAEASLRQLLAWNCGDKGNSGVALGAKVDLASLAERKMLAKVGRPSKEKFLECYQSRNGARGWSRFEAIASVRKLPEWCWPVWIEVVWFEVEVDLLGDANAGVDLRAGINCLVWELRFGSCWCGRKVFTCTCDRDG
ncbi:hypothetical protein Nepgr_024804 [Nepenthes gracilis]|uniref:Uncharacterized protein n=1 Tax=Nepenthes gracilis TaxID=150966 RepID=A0AAD3T5G0_NEPGR|nr:hypothetical protein Nepgr_024804 [Nepenthes gracilis]